eukprot:TRINITY_DN10791_c0_g2_i2.p1 TRINITY_DN10791_c0_g2~~TRINITY_DN10791_c0_g2_i2.p1  ORF type:complete len:432 (+),score=2.91 TRINITY_DN10791_c0_g2_i2:390-1685(+)
MWGPQRSPIDPTNSIFYICYWLEIGGGRGPHHSLQDRFFGHLDYRERGGFEKSPARSVICSQKHPNQSYIDKTKEKGEGERNKPLPQCLAQRERAKALSQFKFYFEKEMARRPSNLRLLRKIYYCISGPRISPTPKNHEDLRYRPQRFLSCLSLSVLSLKLKSSMRLSLRKNLISCLRLTLSLKLNEKVNVKFFCSKFKLNVRRTPRDINTKLLNILINKSNKSLSLCLSFKIPSPCLHPWPRWPRSLHTSNLICELSIGDTPPQTSYYPAAMPAGVVSLLEGGIELSPLSTSHFSMVLCLRTLSFLSVNSPTEGLLKTWLTNLSVFSPLSKSLTGRLKVFCLDTDPKEGSVVLSTHFGPTERPRLSPLLLTGPTGGPVSFESIIPTRVIEVMSEVKIKTFIKPVYGVLDSNKVFYCLRRGGHPPQVFFVQ